MDYDFEYTKLKTEDEQKVTDEQKKMIKEFLQTEDHDRRDELALALCDEKLPCMISFIISLLLKPSTKGHRSTLIYSLSNFELKHWGSEDFIYMSEYESQETNYGCLLELKYLFSKLNGDKNEED